MPQTQFQSSDTALNILPHIKEKDAGLLFELLKPILMLAEGDFVINDLGCGEGLMLLKLLELMHTNLQTYSELQIIICGCEPDNDLREKFIAHFADKANRPYLNNIGRVQISDCKIEDYHAPEKTNVTLSSHSLYYPQSLWNTQRFKDLKHEDHLLTRFLSNLKENGQLCIILQSSASTKKEKRDGGFFANHETYEDTMYPCLWRRENEDDRSRGLQERNSITNNRDRLTFTNAEIFEACLNAYQETSNTPLSIKSGETTASIHLGEINLDQLDTEKNKYEQTPEALSFLNFYTRKRYPDFSADDQKIILDFLKNNCADDEGNIIMHHMNRAFVIRPQGEARAAAPTPKL